MILEPLAKFQSLFQTINYSVEKNRGCHFERAVGESRHGAKRRAPKGNLLLSRFLRFASLRDASVEMTVGLFYRATLKIKMFIQGIL